MKVWIYFVLVALIPMLTACSVESNDNDNLKDAIRDSENRINKKIADMNLSIDKEGEETFGATVNRFSTGLGGGGRYIGSTEAFIESYSVKDAWIEISEVGLWVEVILEIEVNYIAGKSARDLVNVNGFKFDPPETIEVPVLKGLTYAMDLVELALNPNLELTCSSLYIEDSKVPKGSNAKSLICPSIHKVSRLSE